MWHVMVFKLDQPNLLIYLYSESLILSGSMRQPITLSGPNKN